MAKTKINIEEKMIELGYEGFNFSKRTKKYLTYNNLHKDTLITLSLNDFHYKYFGERYGGYLSDIADVLMENGYSKLYDELHVPSKYQLERLALGYTEEFNWVRSVSWELYKNKISLKELCQMTYNEIKKLDGIGHEKIIIIKSELDRLGYKNNIVIGLSYEEQKLVKEKQCKELKEKLISLLIEKSNLDPKNNPYDKWMLSEYKKSIKNLTVKGLESKINQIENL